MPRRRRRRPPATRLSTSRTARGRAASSRSRAGRPASRLAAVGARGRAAARHTRSRQPAREQHSNPPRAKRIARLDGETPAGLVVRHLVDADGRSEYQGLVLTGRDVDPVRVANAEPALGDLGDLVAVALDLVLMVDDVALGVQLAAVREVDGEAIPQRRDQGLLDGGDRLAVALELHRVADAQLLLLDLQQLVAGRRLEHERAAQPQRLAVDLERVPVVLGVDPEVVAD